MRPIWLLFLLLLVVAACSDSGVNPVEVTGTEECRQITSDGLSASYGCEDKTSDPRVSGVATVTVVMEQAPPTAMSGTFELVNDQGRWVGDWTGEITQSQNHIFDEVLVGTGGYEDLEYDAHWEGVDYPFTITGTIRASE
jgi:hypothetical protein